MLGKIMNAIWVGVVAALSMALIRFVYRASVRLIDGTLRVVHDLVREVVTTGAGDAARLADAAINGSGPQVPAPRLRGGGGGSAAVPRPQPPRATGVDRFDTAHASNRALQCVASRAFPGKTEWPGMRDMPVEMQAWLANLEPDQAKRFLRYSYADQIAHMQRKAFLPGVPHAYVPGEYQIPAHWVERGMGPGCDDFKKIDTLYARVGRKMKKAKEPDWTSEETYRVAPAEPAFSR